MWRRIGRRTERAEDHQRNRAAEWKLREVEHELDELALGAPPTDHQRGEGAGDLSEQKSRGSAEQQTESEPDLRQRQRMRLLSELEVDDEDLGQEERNGKLPPPQMRAVSKGWAVVRSDREGPCEGTDDRDDAAEDPDAQPCTERVTHRHGPRPLTPRAARRDEGPA